MQSTIVGIGSQVMAGLCGLPVIERRSGPLPPVSRRVSGLFYLFFAKRRSFPVAMITFMIPATAARIGPAAYGSLAGSVLVAAIWVPYLVRSRRVEAAFIR